MRVPVDELSRDRVTRIEERVMSAYAATVTDTSRLARVPRRRWPWIAVPMAATVAAAAAVLLLATPERTAAPPVSEAPAPAPVRVATSDDATRVLIGDATIDVGPNTALEWTRTADGEIVVDLHTGRVDCEVTPRPNRPAFSVVADDVRVDVVGTVFSVARDLDVTVEVTRGKVQVTARDDRVAVAAGESWTARAATAPTRPAWAVLAQAPERDESKAIAAATADERDEPKTSKSHPTPTPPRTRSPAPPRSPTPTPTPTGDALFRDGELAPVFAGGSAPAALATAKTPNDFRLASARNTGGPAAAEYAAYRAASLAYERGETGTAIRHTHTYEKRYGKRGAYYHHAVWLRVRALYERGDKAACRAAAHVYLRTKGAHISQARKLIDWY